MVRFEIFKNKNECDSKLNAISQLYMQKTQCIADGIFKENPDILEVYHGP